MKRKGKLLVGDIPLWVIFFLLSIISLIAVYTSIGRTAVSGRGTPSSAFFSHLLSIIGAYFVLFVTSRLKYKVIAKCTPFFIVLTLGLLILTWAIGTEGRWLSLPIIHSFQPSELAKIVVVMGLAYFFAKNKEKISERSTFFIALIAVLLTVAFIIFTNLSSAILIAIVGYLMLLFAGVDTKLWIKWGIFLSLAFGAFLAASYLWGDTFGGILHRGNIWGDRIDSWLNHNPDSLTQENMARMAVASGGAFGNGIGSTIHGRLMTQAECDFIYSIIIEEVGIVWALFIPILYISLYFRCIQIASQTEGLYGSLCVAGIGTIIFVQAFLNMGVAVGALPVTGQTLPFISHGGSSYIVMAFGLGIILSVAKYNNQQRAALAKAEAESKEQNDSAQSQKSNLENENNLSNAQ